MDPGLARVGVILREVEDLTSGASFTRIQRYVGGKSKAIALGDAAKDVGGDRSLRNFRGGRVKMGAGWDPTSTGIAVNFRPPGLWKLVDRGRIRTGPIFPKRRGKRAVLTPHGPRARSSFKRSRGLNTFTEAKNDIQRQSGHHTDVAIARELRRIVG